MEKRVFFKAPCEANPLFQRQNLQGVTEISFGIGYSVFFPGLESESGIISWAAADDDCRVPRGARQLYSMFDQSCSDTLSLKFRSDCQRAESQNLPFSAVFLPDDRFL